MAKPLTAEARDERIRMWWEDCRDQESVNRHDMLSPDGDRILDAFTRVLLAMPDEHFRQFLNANPILVWLPRVRGSGFLLHTDGRTIVNIIYLGPDILRMKEENLVRIVAEEVAHIVRGRENLLPQPSEYEGAAMALMAQWGFKPTLSQAQLRKMREEEQRSLRAAKQPPKNQ